MSMEYLGETLDIHTGGEDHIFPHHENEIAQSEGCTGKTFSNYWLHNRFLLVDGQKMSKSKGNFFNLNSIEEKGFSPMDFRLLVLSSHYRSNLNFTLKALEQAKNNFQRISEWTNNLNNLKAKSSEPAESLALDEYQSRFEEAMDDDLGTPLALSVLYELIAKTNKLMADNNLSSNTVKKILDFWKKINGVFGLVVSGGKIEIPNEIIEIAEERKTAREEKDFQKSDELRKKIENMDYIIKDLKGNKYLIRKK